MFRNKPKKCYRNVKCKNISVKGQVPDAAGGDGAGERGDIRSARRGGGIQQGVFRPQMGGDGGAQRGRASSGPISSRIRASSPLCKPRPRSLRRQKSRRRIPGRAGAGTQGWDWKGGDGSGPRSMVSRQSMYSVELSAMTGSPPAAGSRLSARYRAHWTPRSFSYQL